MDDRLIETMIAVIRGAGGSIQVVNLNKALFYADLIALRDEGHTLTGATYVRKPAGPVVKGYKDAIEELEARGWAVQEQITVPSGHTAKPVRLTDEAPDVPDSVAGALGERAGRKTAAWLSDFSHKNPGWLHASENQPINMVLALQQEELFAKSDDDGWMTRPFTEEEMAQIRGVELDDGTRW